MSKKVSVVFEVDSVDELKVQLSSLMAAFGMGTGLQLAGDTTALPNGHANGHADEPPETVVATRRGRPKKEAAPVEEEETDPLAAEEEETEPTTKEEMTKVAKEVNSKLGTPAVREILKKFKCEKLSQIAPTNFADVVEACKLALSKDAKAGKSSSARA